LHLLLLHKLNWRYIAIPVSLIPFLLIAVQFDLTLDGLLAVGIVPFVLASGAMICKLLLQGVKFNYLVRKFFGVIEPAWKTILVRIGSEFVSFTTPMYVGGEVVRVVWLRRRGIKTSKATWVTIIEIVTEVIAGGTIAVIAGVVALFHGAYFIGFLILGIAITVMSLWSVLFFLSSKRVFQIPRGIYGIVLKLGKKRGQKYAEKTNQWMKDICEMSRENFQIKQVKKAIAVSLAISFLYWGIYGSTFFLLANGAGLLIELQDSILAVMGATAIGDLPITIGGSGLVEVGIWSYLEGLKDLTLDVSEGTIEWNVIIAWRIATYHVPLVIAWVLLMKLALSKNTQAEIS